MNRNKITSWLDHQNEKICLNISRTYYRKVESGSPSYYIIHPRFWPLLLLRLLSGLFQTLRFNSSVFNGLSFKVRNTTTNKFEFGAFLLALSGVKHFTAPVFTPFYYAERVNVLSFPEHNAPLVSIIIPVYNQLAFTLSCLRSLSLHLPAGIYTEIIVADDASNDLTAQELSIIPGLNHIRNEQNLGFLKNCNNAMAKAKGTFICLLNNDTIIQKGWLENLMDAFNDHDTGCAGSKLIYPYGLLQEAGGVILDDASGINYGKFNHPDQHLYNFKRQVDYCSGASLLFRKAEISNLGYFDEQYCPAYYEDTDLCFAVTHQLKKKVMYVPTSVVVHFEGVSSGKQAKKGNIKSYQEINRGKFLNKWTQQLNKVTNVNDAARKWLPKKTILAIDNNLPLFDRDSGSNRMLHLINIFKAAGFHVIFVPRDGLTPQPYFNMLINSGVEVIQNYLGSSKQRAEITVTLNNVDIAWLGRPKINQKFAYIFKENKAIKWVYDTVDLHYIRLLREAELLPEGTARRKKLTRRAARYFKLEISLAKRADISIAITNVEADALASNGIRHIAIVPNVHVLKKDNPGDPNGRKGVLFIGNFKHQPNEDAANWLINSIMPSVWEKEPDTKLFIVGSNESDAIRALASSNVIVTGFVKDVDPYFNGARVFVAPLRYGAGMKGKIGQALEYALPTVSTGIGTEGMGLIHDFSVIETDNAVDFSAGIIKLLEDDIAWKRLYTNAAKALYPFSVEVQQENVAAILNSLTK